MLDDDFDNEAQLHVACQMVEIQDEPGIVGGRQITIPSIEMARRRVQKQGNVWGHCFFLYKVVFMSRFYDLFQHITWLILIESDATNKGHLQCFLCDFLLFHSPLIILLPIHFDTPYDKKFFLVTLYSSLLWSFNKLPSFLLIIHFLLMCLVTLRYRQPAQIFMYN